MPTHDKQGRAYARMSDLKPGDLVQVDGDFGCLSNGAVREVRPDGGTYYIECAMGRHYLHGQLDDDDEILIGVYPVSKNEAA